MRKREELHKSLNIPLVLPTGLCRTKNSNLPRQSREFPDHNKKLVNTNRSYILGRNEGKCSFSNSPLKLKQVLWGAIIALQAKYYNGRTYVRVRLDKMMCRG